ncbi:hypothetical protein ZWY2020_052275 [Hordeum vulgare]|nr:hypothetical protein ZWY2020_052275 [Hordeum vulgare]
MRHCTKRRLSLREAVTGNRWMRLLKPSPSSFVLRQLCSLTELASGINFNDNAADHVIRRWTADGTYTAKSAYRCQFEGALRSDDKTLIWSAKAAPRAKTFL